MAPRKAAGHAAEDEAAAQASAKASRSAEAAARRAAQAEAKAAASAAPGGLQALAGVLRTIDRRVFPSDQAAALDAALDAIEEGR